MSEKISKSYPHACPVCKGRGEISSELAQHDASPKYVVSGGNIYACHVCCGSCVIWEYREEDKVEEPAQSLPSIQTVGSAPLQPPNIYGPIWKVQPLVGDVLPPDTITYYGPPNKVEWDSNSLKNLIKTSEVY